MPDDSDGLTDSRGLRLAILEHEQASEVARYRDRLLFTLFYLSLIYLQISGSIVIKVLQNGALESLLPTSLVSLAVFNILFS